MKQFLICGVPKSHHGRTMMDPSPLPADIVKRFAGKAIAVVGYEVDQVYKTPTGDESVPITW